jgi:hypothetical protein
MCQVAEPHKLRRVHSYLHPKQIDTLKRIAKARGVSFGSVVRRAVSGYLSRQKQPA